MNDCYEKSKSSKFFIIQCLGDGSVGHKRDDLSKKVSGFGLWLLLKSVSDYKAFFLAAILFSIISSMSVLGFGHYLMYIVDIGKIELQDFRGYEEFYGLFAIVFGIGISAFCRYYLISIGSIKVTSLMKSRLYEKLITMEPSFFDAPDVSSVASSIMIELSSLCSVMISMVSVMFRSVVTTTGAIIMMFFTSMHLALYTIAIVPLIILILSLVGRRKKVCQKFANEHLSRLSVLYSESLRHISTIQSFVGEKRYCARFRNLVKDSSMGLRRSSFYSAVTISLIVALIMFSVGAVLWIGVREVSLNIISPGQLFSFIFYAVLTVSSSNSLSDVYGDLEKAGAVSERVNKLMNCTPRVMDHVNPVAVQSLATGIVFENVFFSYPEFYLSGHGSGESTGRVPASGASTNEDSFALKGVSFDVKRGRKVALVGPSGGGKSTIIKLLLRFYDPDSGRILIDDKEMQDISLSSLRSLFGVVQQVPAVFSATVFDNLSLGKRDATKEEVWEALEKAQARDFVSDLPDGLDTVIGPASLSEGQKQRLVIARAILRDPAVLLLDEATSALDAENEFFIQKALEVLMSGRTTLVIAHRLSTVVNSDAIIVLNSGCVEAVGKHNDLLRSSTTYAKFAKIQFTDIENS